MTRLFGLIGFPLGHSFSRNYFTQKFLEEGIDAAYQLFPITLIEELPELIKKNPSLHGLNVTIPYKQSVLNYLNTLSYEASEIKAVNTIKIRKLDGIISIEGYNTDAPAFESELLNFDSNPGSTALILGTGGAAAAVAYILKKYKYEYKYVSRKPQMDNEISYTQITDSLLERTKLIVNTTPLGMFPNVDEAPHIPYASINKSHLLFDLVYNPVETQFLSLGKKQGAKVLNGLGMLHKQAALAWEIWQSQQ